MARKLSSAASAVFSRFCETTARTLERVSGSARAQTIQRRMQIITISMPSHPSILIVADWLLELGFVVFNVLVCFCTALVSGFCFSGASTGVEDSSVEVGLPRWRGDEGDSSNDGEDEEDEILAAGVSA